MSVQRVGRLILMKSTAASDPSSGVVVHAGVSSHPASRRAGLRRRPVGAASGSIRNPDNDGAPGTPTEFGLVVPGFQLVDVEVGVLKPNRGCPDCSATDAAARQWTVRLLTCEISVT
jgi:hypothetical protein